MFKHFSLYVFLFPILIFAQSSDTAKEVHLKNIQQLSFGGDNAEAYFSFNGKFLSFQTNNPKWGLKCDQIYNMNIKRAAKEMQNYQAQLISTG